MLEPHLSGGELRLPHGKRSARLVEQEAQGGNMKLIDADALIAEIMPPEDAPNDGAKLILSVFIEAVKSFPAVDAVEVVRCADCVHFEPFRRHDGFCKIDGMLRENDFFCKCGQRREDGDTT